jgi:hypothetical protein
MSVVGSYKVTRAGAYVDLLNHNNAWGVQVGDIIVSFVTCYRSTSNTAGTPTITSTTSGTSWGTVTNQTTGTRYKCAWSWMRVLAADVNGAGDISYRWDSASSTQMEGFVVVLRDRLFTGTPTGTVSNTAYITAGTPVRAKDMTPAAHEDVVWMGWAYYATGTAAVSKPAAFTTAQVNAIAQTAGAVATMADVANSATGDQDGACWDANIVVKHAFMVGMKLQGVPTVTTVAPTETAENTSCAVTLTGTNYFGATGVTVGGHAATSVTVVSDTSITCTFPAHAAAATEAIVVTGPGGNSSGATTFAYYQDSITVQRKAGAGAYGDILTQSWNTSPYTDLAAGLSSGTIYTYKAIRTVKGVASAASNEPSVAYATGNATSAAAVLAKPISAASLSVSRTGAVAATLGMLATTVTVKKGHFTAIAATAGLLATAATLANVPPPRAATAALQLAALAATVTAKKGHAPSPGCRSAPRPLWSWCLVLHLRRQRSPHFSWPPPSPTYLRPERLR